MNYDIKTIQEFKAGSTSAFECIMSDEGAAVFNFIQRHVRQKELANDIFQEACIRIWENRDQLNQPERIRSWIFQISRNAIYTFLKKNEWRLSIEFVDEKGGFPEVRDASLNPRQKAELEEVKILLNTEINNLDDESREILLLRYMGGLKLREISETLNTPRGRVCEILRVSILKLKKRLKQNKIDMSYLP